MIPIVKVRLEGWERKLLEEMASQDYRLPSEELRYLVVQEAKRRGLLASPSDPPTQIEGTETQ